MARIRVCWLKQSVVLSSKDQNSETVIWMVSVVAPAVVHAWVFFHCKQWPTRKKSPQHLVYRQIQSATEAFATFLDVVFSACYGPSLRTFRTSLGLVCSFSKERTCCDVCSKLWRLTHQLWWIEPLTKRVGICLGKETTACNITESATEPQGAIPDNMCTPLRRNVIKYWRVDFTEVLRVFNWSIVGDNH